MDQANELKQRFVASGLVPTIVAERLAAGVDRTYSAADATDFDAVVVAAGADAAGIFNLTPGSPLYPPMRPLQIANSAFLFGKPVAYFGGAAPSQMLSAAGFSAKGGDGVFVSSDLDQMVKAVEDGLRIFKFTSRFPVDS
jgi:catalase